MTRYEIEYRDSTGIQRWTVSCGHVGSIPAHGRLVIAHQLHDGDTDAVEYVGMDNSGRRIFREVVERREPASWTIDGFTIEGERVTPVTSPTPTEDERVRRERFRARFGVVA
jgi:hypothetical protein